MLSLVVSSGTGKAAQVADEPIWGKTGTTENYGDAWFVGSNGELTVAVWVGYPDKLIPMKYEHAGGPVAGGTYPAEIFADFMGSWVEIRETRDLLDGKDDDEDQQDDDGGGGYAPVTPVTPVTPSQVPPAEQAAPTETAPAPQPAPEAEAEAPPVQQAPAPQQQPAPEPPPAPAPPPTPAPQPTPPPSSEGGGGTAPGDAAG
jgi:penicillin-binding protein 1A